MQYILATIASYLLFNIAIYLSLGMGGVMALGLANVLGALATSLAYSTEIKKQGQRPRWRISILGSVGIVAIVAGLRGSHGHLPVSLSIEAVYNGFACLS